MNENIVEKAALGWFEYLGYDTARGADLSPGSDSPLRANHEDVVLEPRLRAALRTINEHLRDNDAQKEVAFR